MDQNRKVLSKNILLILGGSIGGLLAGICISLSAAAVLLYLNSRQTLEVSPATKIQLETPTIAIVSDQKELLDLAESELRAGNPERVKELLGPLVDNWVLADDRISGYRLLGDAELYLGHPQLAAAYFEDLYLLKPSAENLFLLAMAYDAGGNIKRALEKYKELASWEDLPAEIDKSMIVWRIEEIERALGTPVPTPCQ